MSQWRKAARGMTLRSTKQISKEQPITAIKDGRPTRSPACEGYFCRGISPSCSSVETPSSSTSSTNSDEDMGQETCLFHTVPYEIFLMICAFLTEEDYLTLLGVSRYFHRAITEADAVVWRSLCFEKWQGRQGCHNLILYYRQLEEESMREEQWIVALTQRMLPQMLEGMRDTMDTTAVDGVASLSMIPSADGPSWSLREHFNLSVESMESSAPVSRKLDRFPIHERDGEEEGGISNVAFMDIPGEKSKCHSSGGDRDLRWRAARGRGNCSHSTKKRRHNQPRRQKTRTHKHRNRRSHHHRKKGYRQHQKSNRKMSKSARRRLRHQRSKQRMLASSPLQPTATYNAIKHSIPTVPASEVEPRIPLSTAVAAGKVPNIHGVRPSSRLYWWDLSPEERLLQLHRQQTRCSQEETEGERVVDEFLNDSDTSASEAVEKYGSGRRKDFFSFENPSTVTSSSGGSRASSRVPFPSHLNESNDRNCHSISARDLHFTALEEAMLMVRFKCVSLCSLQRRASHILPFTSKQHFAESGVEVSNSKPLRRRHPCCLSNEAFDDYDTCPPFTENVPAAVMTPACGPDEFNLELSSPLWNCSLTLEDEEDTTIAPISWKFAYYMSHREARRTTITLHDLVQGTWMACFRLTGWCHPVRFLSDSTVIIYSPLQLLHSDCREVTPQSTPNCATVPFHILQSGGKISLGSDVLSVQHRSRLARQSCSGCCSSLRADRPRSAESQREKKPLFEDQPNCCVAQLRRAAEQLLRIGEVPSFAKLSRCPYSTTNAEEKSPCPKSFTTALRRIFGWELPPPPDFPLSDVSDGDKEFVEDDWGWTVTGDEIKFFSVDLCAPLYIQRLQRISEMEENPM